MSNYTKELCESFPTIEDIKRATKDVIKSGRDIAFKEFHSANSIERLKKEIMR